MNRNKIVVIGSCNTDMVITTDRLPKPGETVLGGDFKIFRKKSRSRENRKERM